MSILRRRHSGNFAIIGNAVLCDETLSAEGLGVICYLIGRPDNWVLQPGQLADRFQCGRDRIQRIIRELVDAGYIRRTNVRSRNTGAFLGIEYLVLDTKDSPLPENYVADLPQPENPAAAPETELPEPGNPAPVNPPLINTDSNKTESNSSRNRTRKPRRQIAYTEEFERDVWGPYQRKDGTSKANAFKKYQALPPEDQDRVKATIPIYWRMAERSKFDHHLEFFISRRIFETVPLAGTTPTVLQAPAPAIDRPTWETFARLYETNSRWNPAWGPEPGHPRCQMPADLQRKFVNGGLTQH